MGPSDRREHLPCSHRDESGPESVPVDAARDWMTALVGSIPTEQRLTGLDRSGMDLTNQAPGHVIDAQVNLNPRGSYDCDFLGAARWLWLDRTDPNRGGLCRQRGALGWASAGVNLGIVRLALGAEAEALEAFTRTLRVVGETGNLEIIAACLEGFS